MASPCHDLCSNAAVDATASDEVIDHRGASLVRECTPLEPYGRHMQGPRCVPSGVAASYERGTPVQDQHGHAIRPHALVVRAANLRAARQRAAVGGVRLGRPAIEFFSLM